MYRFKLLIEPFKVINLIYDKYLLIKKNFMIFSQSIKFTSKSTKQRVQNKKYKTKSTKQKVQNKKYKTHVKRLNILVLISCTYFLKNFLKTFIFLSNMKVNFKLIRFYNMFDS